MKKWTKLNGWQIGAIEKAVEAHWCGPAASAGARESGERLLAILRGAAEIKVKAFEHKGVQSA